MAELLPRLPPQPDEVPWPATDWPTGPLADDVRTERLEAQLAVAEDPAQVGQTRALLVVHRGRLVVERYAGTVDVGGDPRPVGADTVLPSWSLAKSMLHAAVGVLVGDAALRPGDRVVDAAPGAVPGWLTTSDDPRRAITVEHLLRQRAGLAWSEVYSTEGPSDVVDMLYRHGRDDVAGFVAAQPLVHEPGSPEAYGYSSGTSNLLSGVVRELTGPGAAQVAFLHQRLFAPTGMTSPRPVTDAAGTWVASTYADLTARDLARFGLLYLRDGVADGVRVLPEGWVDHGRTMQHDVVDPDGWEPGAHWWGLPGRPDWFFGSGHEGQVLVVSPSRDLVVVRLGVSEPFPTHHVLANVARVVRAFPRLDDGAT